MFVFVFLLLIGGITLIFTLKKQSKIRKFLIVFFSIIIFLLSIIMIWMYIDSINSKKEYQKRQQQIEEVKELRKKEFPKIKLDFNIFYSQSFPLEINSLNVARVEGRIINNSSIDLQDFNLKYTIKDCTDTCIVVSQNNEKKYTSIPSKQARDLMFYIGYGEQIQFKGVPKIEMEIQDN